MDRLKYRDILYDDRQIGPWPTDKLKRVDKPTNEIVGPIERQDERAEPLRQVAVRRIRRGDPARVHAHDPSLSDGCILLGHAEPHQQRHPAQAQPGGPRAGADSRRSAGAQPAHQAAGPLPRRRPGGHRPAQPVGGLHAQHEGPGDRGAVQVRHRPAVPQARAHDQRHQRLGRDRRPGQLPGLPALWPCRPRPWPTTCAGWASKPRRPT